MVKLCIVLNFETILNYFISNLQISCKKIESNSKASQVLFSLIHLLFIFYPIYFIIYSCSTVTNTHVHEHVYTNIGVCVYTYILYIYMQIETHTFFPMG